MPAMRENLGISSLATLSNHLEKCKKAELGESLDTRVKISIVKSALGAAKEQMRIAQKAFPQPATDEGKYLYLSETVPVL